ncbi:MAG: flagellar basal-body rod protein FlgF [Desulfosarcina sp.]
MSGGMYLAAAGALVQQLRLEMLANNVANINTVGYKAETSVFGVPEAPSSAPLDNSSEAIASLTPYAPPFRSVIDFSQGAIRQTGNPLDVAIEGDGFFSIQTPEGLQYTRQGNFSLNADGVLITPEGYSVLGEGGEITLDEGSVEIDLEGRVIVDGDELDRLRISAFGDGHALKKAGNGRFVLSENAIAGDRPEGVILRQGYLESANVNPVRAMTEMIETSRAFEAYQKVIQSADEATATSINEVGTIR